MYLLLNSRTSLTLEVGIRSKEFHSRSREFGRSDLLNLALSYIYVPTLNPSHAALLRDVSSEVPLPWEPELPKQSSAAELRN